LLVEQVAIGNRKWANFAVCWYNASTYLLNTMSSASHRKRILIAEDDRTISNMLVTQLEMEGYETIHAANGAEAWEVLQKSPLPDMVILDILMPQMNGYEVCRRIRSTPRMSMLPVIFLTALKDPSSRLEGLEAGANDFLSKPWNRTELQARIRTLLRLKDVQDALRKQHRRLSLLYDISRELSAFLDLDQMLSLMLARSAYAVEAPMGSVILLDQQGPRRKIQIIEGEEPKIIDPPHLTPLEQNVASRIFMFRRPLLIADTKSRPNFHNLGSKRSLLATPFLHKQQIQGLIIFSHSQPDQFDSEHLDLLDSIARQTTITIENARLFERVQEERRRFAVLISSMDDAVIATDKDKQVILVNPTAVSLLGYEEEELRATVSPVGDEGQVAVIQDISPLKKLQSMQLQAEQEKTARVRAAFERYMSPELVDQALSGELGLMEKRERREAVVLFADMRGFTRLTVRFSPDDVVSILNEFFTVMTSIAYSHNGTIFDIAGDELMVGFGVPFEMADPIAAAIQAGIEMQTVYSSLSDQWWEVYGDKRLGMGVGVDIGEVIVGNVGSPTRMNYALVGLAVNNAHALVASAADGEVRFSEAVMSRLHATDLAYPITAIQDIRLKGREKPETIYSMAIERPRRED